MRKSVKGMMVGMLTMSMLATAPATVSAGTAAGWADAVYAVEMKAAKPDKATHAKTKAAAQKAGKVTCTSSGRINISFKSKVTYTNAVSAAVRDADGNQTECKIVKKNKKLMTVSAAGLVQGQTYTVTIEGILGKDSSEAVTVEKTFIAKGIKTKCKTGKASVQGGKFVIIKMNSAAEYKDAAVAVTDSKGKACDAKIVKKAKGNIKVQISGMNKGETYKITVSGVKTKKEKSYGSVTKTVTVK